MAFCTSCGNDLGDAAFCTNCGAKDKSQIADNETHELPDKQKDISASAAYPKTAPNKKLLIIGGAALAVIIVFVAITFSTARHWVKTDVPEHPETFRSETYLTGYYDVIDDGINPCWVGQNWVSCTNIHVSEYNATCASYPLTLSASAYCSSYLAMIDDMKSQYASYVATLGGWGSLYVVAEEATQEVSNNDYRPAQTHEAVCYLGFLGECE